MAVKGFTLHVPGTRYTDQGTARICWVVESDPVTPTASEGVLYEVRKGGPFGPLVTSGFAGTKAIVQPNFSDKPSRVPGVPSGMAPVECYYVDINLLSLPSDHTAGNQMYYVAAIARGQDGSTLALDPATFNSDTGSDSRFSTKEVHWKSATGSNSNGGTSASDAVKDLHRAILLACVSNNCGGAVIYQHEDHAGGGGATAPGNWHTGEHQFLTIQAVGGATISRVDPPYSTGADDIAMTGNGVGTFCNVRFRDYEVIGTGPLFQCGIGVTGSVWREGGIHRSAYYDGSINALCLLDSEEIPFDIQPRTGGSTIHKSYCTGELRQGAKIAYSAESLIYDCAVQGTLGGACYIQSWYQNSRIHSVTCTEHSYTRNVTRGWACSQADGFLPKDPLEVQKFGSTMRVLGPSTGTPIPFSTQAAELIGAPFISGSFKHQMGLLFTGFSSGGNNGFFPVTAAGITGGRHYVEVTNAACVAELPNLNALLETAFNGTAYNTEVHTSYISFGTSRTGSDTFRDIAISGIEEETQGAFDNFANHANLLIDNVRGSGGFSNISMGTGSMTNSLIKRCSWTGSTFQSNGAPASWAGTYVTNCVFNRIGSGAAAAIAAGMQMSYCHTIDITSPTPAGATNHTTGTWLAGNPLVSPFSMEPTSGNKGTGNPLVANVDGWRWDDTQSTKGCTQQTGLVNWTIGAVTLDVDVFGAMPQMALAAPQGEIVLGRIVAGAMPSMAVAAPQGSVEVGLVMAGTMPSMSLAAPGGEIQVGDAPEPEEPANPGRGGSPAAVRAYIASMMRRMMMRLR